MYRLPSSGNVIGLIIDISVIFALIIWEMNTPSGLDESAVVINILLFITYFLSMILKEVRIWNGIRIDLKTELGFGIFYFLLFYNPYFKDLLGITPYWKNTMIANTYQEWGNRALIMASLGFVGYHAGTMLVPMSPRLVEERQSDSAVGGYLLFDKLLAGAQLILTSAFLVLGLQSDDTGRYAISDRTQAVQAQAASDGGSTVGNFIYLVILLCCILCISRVIYTLAKRGRLSMFHYVMIINVSVWSVYMVVGGDRNNFFIIALAASGGMAAFLRRVSWRLIIVGALGAMALYQVVEVSRKMEGVSLSELAMAMSADSPGEERSSSFDGSALTLRAMFSVVPIPVPFAQGYYKLVGISGIVPMSRQVIIGRDSGFRTSAEALTYYILGPYAGWSVGTNIISDLYMDWGETGVVVLMGLIGWFTVWIRRSIALRGLNMRRTFIYICSLATISELPRYSFDAPVRLLVWGLLVLVLYEIAFHRRRYMNLDAMRPND